MNPSALLLVPASLAAAALFHSPVAAQSTTRVSVDSAGLEGNGQSSGSFISADGRYVAFFSHATTLVTGDTNQRADVFVHDRQLGLTSRVSVSSSGVQGNSNSGEDGISISGDGRFVAFYSAATNLVPGDTNGRPDIFVRDRQLGLTSRASLDSAGVQGNHSSYTPSLSADGRYVAFRSAATNLVPGDTNGTEDIFVLDRQTGQTSRISVAGSGMQGNGSSTSPAISAGGRFVAFDSGAANLAPGDTNGVWDIFVHDLQTNQTTRVSVNSAGVQGNGASWTPSISADGRHVVYTSAARNLVSGDSNSQNDCFVHDRQTGQTHRISVDAAGVQGNGYSGSPIISADGRAIAFVSAATNLVFGDGNDEDDVFIHDRSTGLISMASVDSSGALADSYSRGPSLSADGQSVAFFSSSTNLVPGDLNDLDDVFVHYRGPGLASTGSCPGAITLTISNATAGGPVVLVHGPAGIHVRPVPPCQGLALGVSPPTVGGLVYANGAGIAVLNFNAPAGACGRSVQAVDILICRATNVIVL